MVLVAMHDIGVSSFTITINVQEPVEWFYSMKRIHPNVSVVMRT